MSWFFIAWSLLAASFTLIAVFRLQRRVAPSIPARRVLLLRPVDAPTPLELENLRAPINYAGEVEHVVLSPVSPRLNGAARWLPSDPLTANRKVGHLAYALATLPRSPDTVVVCIDADVRVTGALLHGLLDALDGAALSSAAPLPSVNATLAGRALRGLLTQSHHNFAALDAMSAGAKAVCGKALALSPVAIEHLVRMGDCIGEDLELSQELHRAGLKVTMSAVAAEVPQPSGPSWPLERFTRWMQVLRAHRPALFPTVPLLFSPTPVLLLAALCFSSAPLWAAVSLLIVARMTLASRLDPRGGLRSDWLLAEGLLLVCWVRALAAGNTIQWRGRTLRLSRDGRLT